MNIKELTDEQLFEEISAIVEERLGVAASEITPEKNLINDLGADSLDSVELIMSIEQKFDISIPEDAAENIKTIGDIISYVKNN
ncbi:MAG: acyl carrier protein [Bacteroidales bacterium]|nr:acyl carrier protein [Bacteroidales bacterium]MBR6330484.1 acyl carrier protein [Bacteroidales bacterium]